jgi:hypothetical protein
MNDMSSWEQVELYLGGATIVEMRTSSGNGLEGGQVIVFEKDGSRGITIMGYTELGNWTYLFFHADNFYYDDYYAEKLNAEISLSGLQDVYSVPTTEDYD